MRSNGRKIKRFICGLLSAMIIFVLMTEPVYAMELNDSMLNATSVNSNETVIDTVINPYYADVLDADAVETELNDIKAFYDQISLFSDGTVYATEAQAVDYLRSQMVQRAGVIEVNVASSIYYSEMFGNMFEAAMAYDDSCSGQEGDALLGVWSGYQGSISGNGSYYTLEYTITYLSTYDQEEELTEAVNAALAELNLTNDTEYTKVYKIYNYICDNVDYDYTSEGTLKHTAYAAMCNKTAVCQGYALLFYRMCKEADLSVRYITGIGNGGAHGWNIVKIGDYYYNLDVTWDGQDATTRSNYFLLNEADFTNHSRDSEYNTTEFHTKFPMASKSWTNYEEIEAGKNLENIPYTFTTIDDISVTTTASGKPKVLIFYSDSCGYSQGSIESISTLDLTGVDVVAINVIQSDKATVSTFKSTYGCDDIVFTYDASGMSNSMMWDYVYLAGIGSSVYYPIIVYIDSNNVVQYVTQGYCGAGAFTNNLNYYCGGFSVEAAESSKSLSKEETYKITTYVNDEKINNAQLEWSTSDANVATVDANGVVTAVGGGSCTITGRLNDSYSVTVNIVVIVPLATPVVTLESTDNGVAISWEQVENATGYIVYRKGTTGGYKKLTALAGVASTSYVDTTAVNGTSYYYTVKAFNTTVQSAFEDYFITYTAGLATPQVSLKSTDSGVAISWGQVENATGYIVYRKGTIGGYKRLTALAGVASTSYVDTTAVNGTSYYYTVKAFNTTVQSAFEDYFITYTAGLATPQVSLKSTDSGVAISWGQVENATGYNVYRKGTTGGYKRIAALSGIVSTSYVDTTAVSGTDYYYTVKAFNTTVQSGIKDYFITYTAGLATPQVSLKSTDSGVAISWGQVENATGYNVYRKGTTGGYKRIAALSGIASTSYVDTTAVEGVSYYYTVKAFNASVQSAFEDVLYVP